jgi:hypothetical protein
MPCMSLHPSSDQWLVSVVFGVTALVTHIAYGQSTPAGEEPKLTTSFTFSLSPYRQRAVGEMLDVVKQQDDAMRIRDRQTANATFFSRTIDLLRFVPFKLSSGNGNMDDFFIPNYLRPDYNAPSSQAHLFDT